MHPTILPRRFAPEASVQSSYLTFGLLSIVAGWTWCASARGGRGGRDTRMIVNAHHVTYACMQSSSAHHAPHYTAQALCAREKRAVVLPHAFGLRSIVAGSSWSATSTASRRRQALRRQRFTARRIGGCDIHCDGNDSQHGRASHGRRGRDVHYYARTIINAHHVS